MSKSSINNLFIGLGFIILALLAYYAFATKTSTTTAVVPVEVSLDDHVRGATNAKVTLLEFGDLQCPACGAYEPLVRAVMAQHTTDTRLVFRHFPLTNIHQNALAAAKYAEAAGIQGKFWEMHDILYDTQKDWSGSMTPTVLFEGYAKKLGLDVAKLSVDAQGKSVEDKILAQYKEGTRLGVQGTPTFFINGVKIDNPQSLDTFNKVLNDAAKK